MLADIKVPTAVYFGNSVEELEIFSNVARSVENVEFVHATDDESLQHFNKFGIHLFKNFDEQVNSYEGIIEKNAIEAFIEFHSQPNIHEFSYDSMSKLYSKT